MHQTISDYQQLKANLKGFKMLKENMSLSSFMLI